MDTQAMIRSVRWRISEPVQAKASDDRIVEELNNAQDFYWSWLRSMDEGWGVKFTNLDTVAGEDTIDFPADALDTGLKLLQRKLGDARWSPVTIMPLQPLQPGTGAQLDIPPDRVAIVGRTMLFSAPFGSSEVGAYRLWHEYAPPAMDKDAPSVSSPIPAEHHLMLPVWVVTHHFSKVGEHAGQWGEILGKLEERFVNSVQSRVDQGPRYVQPSPDDLEATNGYDYIF